MDRWISTLSRQEAITLACGVDRIGPNTAEKIAAIDEIISCIDTDNELTPPTHADVAALLPLHYGPFTHRVIADMIDRLPPLQQMQYVRNTTIAHLAVLNGRWQHLEQMVRMTGGTILSVCETISIRTPIGVCPPNDLPLLANVIVNAWSTYSMLGAIEGTHMREVVAGGKMFGSYVVDALCAHANIDPNNTNVAVYRAARAGATSLSSIACGEVLPIHVMDIIDNADKYSTLAGRIALIEVAHVSLRMCTLLHIVTAAVKRKEPAELIKALLRDIDPEFVAHVCCAKSTLAQVIAYGDEESACAFVKAGVTTNDVIKGQNMLERACRARMRVLARLILARATRPQPLASVNMWIAMMDIADMNAIVDYVTRDDIKRITSDGLPANAPAAASANLARVCELLRLRQL